MKRYLKKLVCSISIILLIAGCAREAAVPVSEGYITTKEKEWLEKAYRYDKNGWIFLHIEGGPFERGFQRGYLTANEIDELLKTMAYILKFETAKDLDYFVEAAAKLFKGKVSKEYIEEMKGMVAGMEKAGKTMTFEEMLFLNGFIDICWYWWPKEKNRWSPVAVLLLPPERPPQMAKLLWHIIHGQAMQILNFVILSWTLPQTKVIES